MTADFEGGLISSDGGLVLLRGAERRLGLAETLAGCIREWRDPALVVHTLPAMLRFRMFAIACGYEDADDCDALRTDPLFKLTVGRAPESGRALCSQPTMSRLENAPSRLEVARMTAALVDLFCRSFPTPPAAITAGSRRPRAMRTLRATRSGDPPSESPSASPPISSRRFNSGDPSHVHANFARIAETGCRSPDNRLLLRYFPIARESDPGALVFVPQAAGFKLASLLDLVWRYHPPITWSSRILCASFKAIWASHLRENLDLGLVAGARNHRYRHSIEVPV